MARLAEDSDSDASLPELKDVLKGTRWKAASARTPAPRTQRLTTNAAKKPGNPKLGSGDEKTRGLVEHGQKSVKKKRVLCKRDDNPLLRPLGRTAREERTKSSLVRTTVLTESVSGIKIMRRGEVSEEVGVDDAGEREAVLGTRMSKVRALKERGRRKDPESVPLDFLPLEAEREEREVEPPGLGVLRLDEAKEESIQVPAWMSKGRILSRRNETTLRNSKETAPFDETSESVYDSENVISNEKVSKPKEPVKLFNTTQSSNEIITIDSDNEECLSPIAPKKTKESEVSTTKRRKAPLPRTKSKYILTDTEEEDSSDEEGSDGMSDFIVSDHESIEGDSSLMETSPPQPPPKSARKLVQGRRRRSSESNEDNLDSKMGNLRVDDDVFGDFPKSSLEDRAQESFVNLPTKSCQESRKKDVLTMKPPAKKERPAAPTSSDIEDPFTLKFSPSKNICKPCKETRFTTPPSSPKLKPTTIFSPTKFQRIPTSPHRQNSDAFWAPDIINDWNDEYSPQKPIRSPIKPINLSPLKAPRLTKETKKVFSQVKYELAASFLRELDEKITQGRIAEMAASTGGVKIVWNKKLNTTAGRANWKRETLRPKPSSSSTSTQNPAAAPTYRHHAAIELAEKVIDDEPRLLNVLAHEFCHLANFMISNMRTNPHGKEFKAWAAKVSSVFRERGIEVTTKHSYEIEYKYMWECENCGLEYKRHSKSIDVKKHRCGVCKFTLRQTMPVPRGGAADGGGGGGGEKKLSAYQTFVKENMSLVRKENPGSPQKEIMGLVGKKYQELKASRLKESVGVDIQEVDVDGSSKEGTPDVVGDVVRKLDFLDLTSP